MLKFIKNNFLILLQLSIWILSIITPFILTPPRLSTDQADNVWLKFSQVILAIFIGILFVPIRKYRKVRYATKWWLVSIVLFILNMVCIFWYTEVINYRTVRLEVGRGQFERFVIGSEYTGSTKKYKKQEEDSTKIVLSNEELIMQTGGDFEQIWTENSILKNKALVFFLYCFLLMALTSNILSVVQAIRCLGTFKK